MRQARLGFIFVLSSLLWFTFLSCFLPGDCRGVVVATRYDKLAHNYLATVALAAIVTWCSPCGGAQRTECARARRSRAGRNTESR